MGNLAHIEDFREEVPKITDEYLAPLYKIDGIDELMKRVFPIIVNDVLALVGRPIRFVWDPSMLTAATDAIANIFMNPRPFIEGFIEEGMGSVYHETGHINYDGHLEDPLGRARARGGELHQNLMNLLLDKKDDKLTARNAPGFALLLRKRMTYLGTLFARAKHKDILTKYSEREKIQLLKNLKPSDPYEDFFNAIKWGKRARFKQTHKALKYCKTERLINAGLEELLWICDKVRAILGEPHTEEQQENDSSGEDEFNALCQILRQIEQGSNGEVKQFIKALQKAIHIQVDRTRHNGLQKLIKTLKGQPMIHPGPLSVGRSRGVELISIPPKPENATKYAKLLGEVQYLIAPLLRKLSALDSPAELELYGQDDGDLDLDEVALIASGLPGFYKQTVVERDIDASIHLAIDSSRSMGGDKIHRAKMVATIFSEAILKMKPSLDGQVWGYDSEGVYQYGDVSKQSGFVNLNTGGGNSDIHMLCYVGEEIAKSDKKRKVIIVLADDGPDSINDVTRLCQTLLARGILVIHMLVGVHASPEIFPIQLLYNDMDEAVDQFGNLLETIVKHLK